jgi:hypothetical protein
MKRLSLAAIVVIALVLTITTYAFAASNTMPTMTSAGDGATTVAGYEITSVSYILDATDPSTIDSVNFTITPLSSGNAPTTTKIQLVSGGSWFTCDVTGTAAVCDISGAVTVLAANTLHVVAAQ